MHSNVPWPWLDSDAELPEVTYDRDALVQVITYHRKIDIKGCMCGWAELGKDHSQHVADVYEESVRER